MLSLEQINKSYSDGTQALKDITLNVPNGMVGLLGPNGAGKSTLMRTIACLQPPSSGTLFFNGINILNEPQLLRQQLGYLPQAFGVYPNMSCRALLEHLAVLKGLSKAARTHQIGELLELTNLHDVARKKVASFSGGMKQRFGIAQALLGDPKLIIMDEPTAGLDPVERASFNKLLVNISRDKLVLLSTHIVDDIESLCQYVAIMNKGEVIKKGNVYSFIEPLESKIWQLKQVPKDFPKRQILSETFSYGQAAYRVFSESVPAPNATQVVPRLHDAYFNALQLEGESLC